MIHRTRQGKVPSGGAASNHSLVEIGDVWVEYSGDVPTEADLHVHLHPPFEPSDSAVLLRALVDKVSISVANLAAARKVIKEEHGR